jgi:hypothetical protein
MKAFWAEKNLKFALSGQTTITDLCNFVILDSPQELWQDSLITETKRVAWKVLLKVLKWKTNGQEVKREGAIYGLKVND